jgi:DNA-binding CsgD family transcriptional regulator
MMRSLLRYREGALDDAVADAQLATDVSDEHGWGAGLPMAVGFLVDALVEQGRLDEAADALRRAGVGDEAPDTLLAQALLVARGRLAIARGELRAAVGHLEELARRTTGEGWSGIVGAPTHRAYLAPALAALGEHDRATELAEEEIELATAWGAPRAIGTALRTRGVVAARDGGAELLAEAVAVLAPTPARLEHARALADLGAALRRDGQAAAAREPLREAIDLAQRCGATPLVTYAQDELAATGARRRSRLYLTGVESLTPSERRIAGMAADGLSNGEIAQALFLTRKTIEMHLGNAYRKLDIRSRADLPAAMSREAPRG